MARPHWFPCAVGIGSNLDDPADQVRWAIEALRDLPQTRVEAVSALYRNPPMGPTGQPWYVNAVVCILTGVPAARFLASLHRLERERGRDRSTEHRWGPRRLDLDLLTWGSQRYTEPSLTVPHPGISERNFVLFPLMELAPGLDIPGHGIVSELAGALGDSGLEKIELWGQ